MLCIHMSLLQHGMSITSHVGVKGVSKFDLYSSAVCISAMQGCEAKTLLRYICIRIGHCIIQLTVLKVHTFPCEGRSGGGGGGVLHSAVSRVNFLHTTIAMFNPRGVYVLSRYNFISFSEFILILDFTWSEIRGSSLTLLIFNYQKGYFYLHALEKHLCISKLAH